MHMNMTPQPPIEVVNVTKTYRSGAKALNGASFTIGSGDHVCLLGPNGAGKTTLIRLLTGALQPTHGSARVFGIASHERAFLHAKRRIGIVPQAPGMYRDITAGEYLVLVRELYGRGDISEVREAFGLNEVAELPMAQLSGGYQRRLALAAAVLPEPDLLLLDEPTVGLDPVATREVHTYLRSVMPGRTTLLCTHNLAEAEALCDSVVILRGGRVLLHDHMDALRKRARTQIELAATQGSDRLVQELTRLGLEPRRRDQAVFLSIADPQQDVPPILRALLATGLDMYECRIHKPSLEDLFLEIVGGSDDHA